MLTFVSLVLSSPPALQLLSDAIPSNCLSLDNLNLAKSCERFIRHSDFNQQQLLALKLTNCLRISSGFSPLNCSVLNQVNPPNSEIQFCVKQIQSEHQLQMYADMLGRVQDVCSFLQIEYLQKQSYEVAHELMSQSRKAAQTVEKLYINIQDIKKQNLDENKNKQNQFNKQSEQQNQQSQTGEKISSTLEELLKTAKQSAKTTNEHRISQNELQKEMVQQQKLSVAFLNSTQTIQQEISTDMKQLTLIGAEAVQIQKEQQMIQKELLETDSNILITAKEVQKTQNNILETEQLSQEHLSEMSEQITQSIQYLSNETAQITLQLKEISETVSVIQQSSGVLYKLFGCIKRTKLVLFGVETYLIGFFVSYLMSKIGILLPPLVCSQLQRFSIQGLVFELIVSLIMRQAATRAFYNVYVPIKSHFLQATFLKHNMSDLIHDDALCQVYSFRTGAKTCGTQQQMRAAMNISTLAVEAMVQMIFRCGFVFRTVQALRARADTDTKGFNIRKYCNERVGRAAPAMDMCS